VNEQMTKINTCLDIYIQKKKLISCLREFYVCLSGRGKETVGERERKQTTKSTFSLQITVFSFHPFFIYGSISSDKLMIDHSLNQ